MKWKLPVPNTRNVLMLISCLLLHGTVNLHSENFEFEASVIIPVRNRAHTIRDAVNSALNQRTTFSFNIIVIDNHSTDGTTEILQELSSDKRLIHIIPKKMI